MLRRSILGNTSSLGHVAEHFPRSALRAGIARLFRSRRTSSTVTPAPQARSRRLKGRSTWSRGKRQFGSQNFLHRRVGGLETRWALKIGRRIGRSRKSMSGPLRGLGGRIGR